MNASRSAKLNACAAGATNIEGQNVLRRNDRGITLVEILVATTLLVIVVAGFMSLILSAGVNHVKAKQRMVGDKLLEMGFSRLKSIDFFYLFPMDSAQPAYGLSGTFKKFGPGNTLQSSSTNYPYLKILDDFSHDIKAAKFDRFTVEIVYMRRDVNSPDNNLVPFSDLNNDGRDDADPGLRFEDFDADGKYWATYISTRPWPYTGQRTPEVPGTGIRQATLKLWKNGKVAIERTTLINRDLLSGLEKVAMDSILPLKLSSPTVGGAMFQYITTEQQSAQNLALLTAYPSFAIAFRADSVMPLRFFGRTDPLADIQIGVNGSGVLATITANGSGIFDASPPAVTSALIEGKNTLTMIAVKGVLNSPIKTVPLILDVRPPDMTPMPANLSTVGTYTPVVGATLFDTTTGTNNVSGICTQVTSIRIDGISYPVRTFLINPNSYAVYATTDTKLPVKLTPGMHTVIVEAGDLARYKINRTLTFTVNVPTDLTEPVIEDCVPSGGAAVSGPRPIMRMKITDEESGIDPDSIVFSVDGVPAVSAALGNIWKYYDPISGIVTYEPDHDISSGGHTFTLSGANWASPALSQSNTCTFTSNP